MMKLNEAIALHEEVVGAHDLAAQLYENRNNSCDSGPAPDSFVPVAIAGHNESPQTVEVGIEQYANQPDADFTMALVFAVNAPKDNEDRGMAQRIEKIECTLGQLVGDLPFPASFYVKRYNAEQHTIGNVRREEVAAGLAFLRDHFYDRIDENLSIIPGDIDLLHMAAGALRKLHEYTQEVPLAQPNIIHGRTAHLQRAGLIGPEKAFPNSDEVMYWYDLAIAHNPFARQGPYFAMSAKRYLEVGGYDAAVASGEDFALQREIRRQAGSDVVQERRLPPQYAIVSSQRRMLTALAQGASPLQTWDKVQFGPTEDFRDIDCLAAIPDISVSRAAELVGELKAAFFASTIRGIAHTALGRDSRWRQQALDLSRQAEKEALDMAREKIEALLRRAGRTIVD